VRAELADRHKKTAAAGEETRRREREKGREGAGDEMRVLLGKRWKKQGAGSPG